MTFSDENVGQALDKSIDWVFKAADLVSEYFEGEEKEQHMKDLEETLKELCTTDRKFNASQKIITKMEEEQEENTDVEYADLRQTLDESFQRNKSKIDKYQKHERYVQFVQNYRTAENAAGSDEELVCTNAEIYILDPYTKLPIKEPIKNTRCGHHYEKSSVLEVFKKKSEQRCPNPGCACKKFTVHDLKEDRQLTKLIQQRIKESQAMNESSSSTTNVE